MNRVLTCLFVTGIALIATAPPAVTAPLPRPAEGVDILVGGTPQTRYAHEGRWYVEALRGREYAIRLHNPYGVRVAVALSVDGLNTIDARRSTASDARKWVIEPYGTITISGWQTSRTAARRFEFTTEERSYAQALGQGGNMGVISAVFFRERRPVITRHETGERQQEQRAAGAPPPAAEAQADAADAGPTSMSRAPRREEYAATGMGRETAHPVTQVRLDLEDTPARTVQIRYEYRPQLVALGILPADEPDRLRHRERATGFEPGFSPVPRSLR
jgi:hypothetical protein